MRQIKKLLVANRSEIAIRVFRSAYELGIRTVAIYTYEDRFALHRFKADEAYQIGRRGEPIKSYLDIDAVIDLSLEHGVDAIHPGYGFLSENPKLAQACADNGITFIGPSVAALHTLGDKTIARDLAQRAGVPVLAGSPKALVDVQDGLARAESLGFPVILKAAHGGGGRGMRVVRAPADFAGHYEQARRESLTAFGSPDIFVEKFIERARHIEVQLLGDRHGTLVHLFERDCSVQRRHQKVVEIAPAPNFDSAVRDALCDAAIRIGREVGYDAAGTVEFLVDADTNRFFFIEVNPRIQVEHTVTEEVTGIDIVKSQILIAQGERLSHDLIGIESQASVRTTGIAVQFRVTTEDPSNSFLPDYGRVAHYRSAGGMGIRLDAGSAFSGAVVNPFYDSLLVKVTAHGRRFDDAVRKLDRCLAEFRIRGVRTNIPFLVKVLRHPTFLAGSCTTRFIDETPGLFQFPKRQDRATKLLTYLGETIVNGHPLFDGQRPQPGRRDPAPVPDVSHLTAVPQGTRDRLRDLGPTRFATWVREQNALLMTDTTFRDAHQSLLATRLRTKDVLGIAEAYSRLCPQLFSLEMWGGATFDTAMRFLKEDPWQRLADMREKVPNILFQMLLRASNAVGYTNYPDNVVRAFVREAAECGMDVFRIFDSLNCVPNMQVAMDAVLTAAPSHGVRPICEAAICYSGDITNPARTKYSLRYYIQMAKQLERMGAHILAIKDMAGLCKPRAARELVRALRQEIGIPIHFHTHDTGGIQAASILMAAEEGLDIADGAMAPMSGGTSQPNLNFLSESLRFSPRETGLDSLHLDEIAAYWKAVRQFYAPFESEQQPATTDLYAHEMPGGQYTNLYQQARSLGLAGQWPDICRAYAQVNLLFGDIVKVTPSSKAVGDMALFMVANRLTPDALLDGSREFAFPESVIELLSGAMGFPDGGFPERIQRLILKERQPFTTRPGESLPPADFTAVTQALRATLKREPTQRDTLSSVLYPKVFEDFARHVAAYSDTSTFPTPVFFYGMNTGEEIAIDIEAGKTLIIKYLTMSEPHADGSRNVFFELNGQPRDVTVVDRSLEPTEKHAVKADPDNASHVGASMPGMVVTVAVQSGDSVSKGQKLLTVEAMKMETTIAAERDGKVADVYVKAGSQVATGDLLLKYA
ncbi:MAG: pyruvate carboxylase [Vicinamibacterales bacterium]